MLNQRRKDSTLRAGAAVATASSVSFALDGTGAGVMGRQSSVASLSPSMTATSTAPAPAPMLGQTVYHSSSRFFGVSARGAKLTRPLSTTADLGVLFTVCVGRLDWVCMYYVCWGHIMRRPVGRSVDQKSIESINRSTFPPPIPDPCTTL
jgi:hypothetical protein